jgi:hypothetical protein
VDVSPESGGPLGPASGLGLRSLGAMTSSMSEGLCCIVWMYIVYIYDVVGDALTFFLLHVKAKNVVGYVKRDTYVYVFWMIFPMVGTGCFVSMVRVFYNLDWNISLNYYILLEPSYRYSGMTYVRWSSL